MSDLLESGLISKMIDLFKAKPYAVNMGAKLISKQFKMPEYIVRVARKQMRAKAGAVSRDNVCVKSSEAEIVQFLKQNKIKILFLDIETAPLIVDVWKLWQQLITPKQLLSGWFMLCYAAKWLGKDKIISSSLTSEEAIKQDDSRIASELRELLEDADIIITYNGVKFDIPKINTRLLIHGITIPSLYRHVDLYKTIKSEFSFESNSLDYVNKVLELPTKLPLDKAVWLDCYSGNGEALDEMRKYNENDVIILEMLYNKLKPWIKRHPNLSLYTDVVESQCGVCGSVNLTVSKYEYTAIGKYPTFTCGDCNSIVRGRRSILTLEEKKKLLKNR